MSITDKIAHFLKLAEDEGATQAERDTASEQAERLMVRHGIDRFTALAQDSNTDRPAEKIIVKHVFFGGLYAESRMRAAYSVVLALKLKAYKSTRYGVDMNSSHGAGGRMTKGIELFICGFESDVDDAITLIGSLDIQGALAVKRYVKECKDTIKNLPKGFSYNIQFETEDVKRAARFSYADNNGKVMIRRSFIEAFGQGAGTRISASRRSAVQEAEAASHGTALAIIDRDKQVSDYYAGLKLGKGRGGSARRDSYAQAAGRTAGMNAATGGRSLAGASRSIGR